MARHMTKRHERFQDLMGILLVEGLRIVERVTAMHVYFARACLTASTFVRARTVRQWSRPETFDRPQSYGAGTVSGERDRIYTNTALYRFGYYRYIRRHWSWSEAQLNADLDRFLLHSCAIRRDGADLL
jgi:hypothetical protein